MGRAFQLLCKLWRIVQKIQAFYFTGDRIPLQERVPLAFAEDAYRQLLSLADILEKGTTRSQCSRTHELAFQ